VLANVAFGASIVVYNSFLPHLSGPDDRDKGLHHRLGIGYLGGGLLLLLKPGGSHSRWATASARPRSRGGALSRRASGGPPSPRCRCVGCRTVRADAGERRGGVLTDGFKQLGHTLKSLKAYPLTLFFLIAFLVYNDGIQTVITQASVYADKQLGAGSADSADHHPDGAVPGVRRRDAARLAGQAHRRLEDRADQPGCCGRSC